MSKDMSELLTTKERRAIRALVRSFEEHLADQVLRITLFGSKARGDSTGWSDIDILIIVREENWDLRSQVSTLAADISLEYDVLIGPRVIGRERWERMKKAHFGLYKSIASEGVPIGPGNSKAA